MNSIFKKLAGLPRVRVSKPRRTQIRIYVIDAGNKVIECEMCHPYDTDEFVRSVWVRYPNAKLVNVNFLNNRTKVIKRP